MTPEDVAAIRATLDHNGTAAMPAVILALCDALESAWADWEIEHDKWLGAECDLTEARKRAEKAETELEFQRRWCSEVLGVMPPTQKQNAEFLAALDTIEGDQQ